MTEQLEAPVLNESYVPAVQDSRINIRFVGNTSRMGSTEFIDIDPFQMIALAEYLKMKAFQFIQAAEMEEAKRLAEEEAKGKIETAVKLPPGGFVQKG